MFEDIEKEAMKIAVADVGDCNPDNAELILDTINYNILSGCLLSLRKVLEMCNKDMNQWEIKEEVQIAIVDLEHWLLKTDAKYRKK